MVSFFSTDMLLFSSIVIFTYWVLVSSSSSWMTTIDSGPILVIRSGAPCNAVEYLTEYHTFCTCKIQKESQDTMSQSIKCSHRIPRPFDLLPSHLIPTRVVVIDECWIPSRVVFRQTRVFIVVDIIMYQRSMIWGLTKVDTHLSISFFTSTFYLMTSLQCPSADRQITLKTTDYKDSIWEILQNFPWAVARFDTKSAHSESEYKRAEEAHNGPRTSYHIEKNFSCKSGNSKEDRPVWHYRAPTDIPIYRSLFFYVTIVSD